MNVDTSNIGFVNRTMLGLYEAHNQLKYLAAELKANHSPLAAEELAAEVEKLGAQITQIEGVLCDHDLSICLALQKAVNENPPRFINVDMGIPGGSHTCFKGMEA